MIKNVCVFASSSNKLDEEFYSDASELGQLLGAHGMNIVYGGSRLGAMYARVPHLLVMQVEILLE